MKPEAGSDSSFRFWHCLQDCGDGAVERALLVHCFESKTQFLYQEWSGWGSISTWYGNHVDGLSKFPGFQGREDYIAISEGIFNSIGGVFLLSSTCKLWQPWLHHVLRWKTMTWPCYWRWAPRVWCHSAAKCYYVELMWYHLCNLLLTMPPWGCTS